MNTNEKLFHLYNEKWDTLCKVLDENGLYEFEYSPLLLSVNNPDDFDSADIKVMLFGQDMSGGDWYHYDRHTQPLTECMKAIRTFDNTIGAIDLNGHRGTKCMGRGMNRFIDTLNTHYPNKKIRYVWNDITKLGRNIKKGNWQRDLLARIEKETFNVVAEEINAIRPQILVFLTGPDVFWESRLQQCLGINGSHYQQLPDWNGNVRQLAILNLDKNKYPSVEYAFRTYHPCARECKIYVKHADIYQAIAQHIQL